MKKSIRILALFCLFLLFLTSCEAVPPPTAPSIDDEETEDGDGLMQNYTPETVTPKPVSEYELYTFLFSDSKLTLPLPKNWTLQEEMDGVIRILDGKEEIGYAARGRCSNEGWKILRETVRRMDSGEGLFIVQYIEQKHTGEKATFRQRVYISSQKYEMLSFTIAVDYASFHEQPLSRLLTESHADMHEG